MTRFITPAVLCVALLFVSCEVEHSPLVNANEMFAHAVSLFDEGSIDQAEVSFTQAIPVYENEGELSKLAESYSYLGRISLARGQFKNALETAQTAFEYSRQANDFRGQARIHLLQGDIYQVMGDYRKALEQFDASYSLSSAFDDRASKATASLKKGFTLYCMSRWDEALLQYENALAYYRIEGESNNAALALLGFGEAYHRQRRYGEALSSLTQAKDLLSASEKPAIAGRLWASLGNVYRAMNDGNGALQQFRDGANRLRSLKAAKEFETLLLFSIGTIYNESGRFDDAKRFYTEAAAAARATGDRLAENYNYLFIANATERRIPAQQPAFEIDKRIESYLQIAQRFQDCGHMTGEAYAYARAGDLYRSVGRLAEARTMYERTIQLEEQRFGEYLSQDLHMPYQIELEMAAERESWYRRLAETLLGLHRQADALRVLDRARSQFLGGLVRKDAIAVRNTVLQEEMGEFREKLRECTLLQLELSSLLADRDHQASPRVVQQTRARIARLKEEMKALAERITRQHPNYGPLTQETPLGLSELQNVIPRGSLVLTFLAGERELSLFAVSRARFEVKTVPIGREKLLGLVNEYLRLLRDPNVYAGAAGEASLPAMTRFARLSSELYEYLLRPVDGMMERSLLIIPGRDFENLPFHAMERQHRDGTIQYLVEISNVDYLASLSSMRFRTSPVGRIREILAVGDPTGRNWSIDYELRDIRSFFKDANVLIGFEATWNSLTQRSDILQLSTDFKINPGTYPFGMMALSDGETFEESVDIPFEQITSLPSFPVVVLSNTGQGAGLTPVQAFLLRMNGTSDVFYNSWGAERKAAKFFSEFFYTHLSNGLAPGDAYRQALLNLIRTHETSHPYSWAQFFHYGVG